MSVKIVETGDLPERSRPKPKYSSEQKKSLLITISAMAEYIRHPPLTFVTTVGRQDIHPTQLDANPAQMASASRPATGARGHHRPDKLIVAQ